MKDTIVLNNREYPHREGATVSTLMAENDFDYPVVLVRINTEIVEKEEWATAEIAAGDKVDIIHICAGG